MEFRPCIDLRHGKVVQIVGGSIDESNGEESAVVNHTSERPPADFAEMYLKDGLRGGHVISLGPGNEEAALEALRAHPGGLQIGGGVTTGNAKSFLDAGASHVIVTSFIFHGGHLNHERLQALVKKVGKSRLVLDLSCRRKNGIYHVVTDRWQNFTELAVDSTVLENLAEHCAEFLVHGVDVEGLRCGIDEELVEILGRSCPIPVTYAGGARDLNDFERVKALGRGRVHLTIGSALDIFGGSTPYQDVVAWHRQQSTN